MTAELLTATQLKEHLETDLGDDALQRILDAEEGEITRRYGAIATETDILPGGDSMLTLSRKASSITSVTELVSTTSTALATDDWRAWADHRLERLATGTNARTTWGDRVTVVYTPVDRTDQRTLVLVQLCKLALVYGGLASESIGGGDYVMRALPWGIERETLLATLEPEPWLVA
jgi:hypothetical protein